MRNIKCSVVLLLLFILLPISSFAQNGGSIPFASAPPLKISFPAPGSIILFFNSPRCESCNQNLEVYALTPKGNIFEKVYIGALDTDGDPPVVESVFLGPLNSKSDGNLFILVSWKSNHPGAGIYTKNYATYVFGREQDGKHGLKRLTDIESKIGQTSEGSVEGDNGRPEQVVAKYKNADDVRKILKNLGY
jgi:hypothetical protein